MTKLQAPFSGGFGSVIMPIPMIPNLPSKLTLAGQTYRAVPELHCTLVSINKLAAGLVERDQLSPEAAEERASAVAAVAINRVKPTFDGYLNEILIVDKPSVGKRTVVAMARVKGLREVFDEINRELGLEQPVQPAHVTLFMEGKNFPFGIALNSPTDLEQYTRALSESDRKELTTQLDTSGFNAFYTEPVDWSQDK